MLRLPAGVSINAVYSVPKRGGDNSQALLTFLMGRGVPHPPPSERVSESSSTPFYPWNVFQGCSLWHIRKSPSRNHWVLMVHSGSCQNTEYQNWEPR